MFVHVVLARIEEFYSLPIMNFTVGFGYIQLRIVKESQNSITISNNSIVPCPIKRTGGHFTKI